MTARNANTLIKIARCIKFFRTVDEFTISELAAATGYSTETLGRLVRRMNEPGPDRVIRVCDWRNDQRGVPTIKVYEFEPGPDMRRPRAFTSKERMQQARDRARRNAQRVAQAAILEMSR